MFRTARQAFHCEMPAAARLDDEPRRRRKLMKISNPTLQRGVFGHMLVRQTDERGIGERKAGKRFGGKIEEREGEASKASVDWAPARFQTVIGHGIPSLQRL